jgi:hypothetical protein
MSPTLAKSNGKVSAEILDRQPPSNIEAEKGLLGSILLKPDICDQMAEIVQPDDFYAEENQKLFAHILGLHRRGVRVDLPLLRNRLNSSGDYELIGGPGYLAELSQSVPYAANAEHYAKIVKQHALSREIIHIGSDLLRLGYAGTDPAQIAATIGDQFDEVRRRTMDDTGLRPVKLSTLLRQHTGLREPRIEGLVRRGETANIVSHPKIGKSWFVYGLALSIIMGVSWLNRFICRPGRVLLIDNELHRETLLHRVPIVANAMAIQEDEYADGLEAIFLRGKLLDLFGIMRLLESVKPGEFDVIILDSFYRAIPKGYSENDNGQMAELYNEIDKTAGRLDCTWINIHHASKGNQANKSVTDVGAGAGAQSRATDCHLVLREHQEPGCAVLEGAVRSFEPVEPVTLRWTFPIWTTTDGVDPAAVKGRGSKSEERQADLDRDGCYKLINALRAGPATPRDLRGKLGAGPDRCQRILDMLESKGTVTWTAFQKRGNECRMYSLKGEPE